MTKGKEIFGKSGFDMQPTNQLVNDITSTAAVMEKVVDKVDITKPNTPKELVGQIKATVRFFGGNAS
jgi:hypothetical protein